MGGYRFLEHVSDALIEAWGESVEEAFRQAGIAFFDVMIDISKVAPRIEREIIINGFDYQSLLYNWLEKLLILFETENLVFSDFKVKIVERERLELKAKAIGEAYDYSKHSSKVAVKAVTFHQMDVKLENGCKLRFLLDI